MKTIHKFGLNVDGRVSLEIDRDAIVRHVGQDGMRQGCIWLELETTAPKQSRIFAIFGTGEDLAVEEGLCRQFLGSFKDQEYIWHVYELISDGSCNQLFNVDVMFIAGRPVDSREGLRGMVCNSVIELNGQLHATFPVQAQSEFQATRWVEEELQRRLPGQRFKAVPRKAA